MLILTAVKDTRIKPPLSAIQQGPGQEVQQMNVVFLKPQIRQSARDMRTQLPVL